MKTEETEKFEEFLAESFRDGVHIRELRLSGEETEYIKRIYPKATLDKNQPIEAQDGKAWYKVMLTPSKRNEKSAPDAEKFSIMEKENQQLKQELEKLKQELNEK